MKRKSLFILLFAILTSTALHAYHAEINRIYYNFSEDEAMVTYYSRNYNYAGYSGAIVIPDSVTYNGKTYCVTSIGDWAFNLCDRVTSVTIPNSVKSIGKQAFSICYNMRSVTIGNSVTSIGIQAFYGCSALTSIIIPNSVTSIGNAAFLMCTGLTSISIPNSVISIGEETFKSCFNLATVSIPNSVTNIGIRAFAECEDLFNVYCYADDVPTAENTAFEGSPIGSVTLHVPAASVDAYNTSEPWSAFKNIVGIESYSLTYMVDGEGYKSYEIMKGMPIVQEEEPTKEGYTFSGWSEIPETMPDHDVVITGTFTINQYTITFDTDGGSKIETIVQDYNSAITPPADPSKEGHTFIGWEPTIPETMPEGGLTCVAQWQINSYILTYLIDNEEYQTFSFNYGTEITPEEEPIKEGYSFSGWSEIPETMPAHDVIVSGAFTINSYSLT